MHRNPTKLKISASIIKITQEIKVLWPNVNECIFVHKFRSKKRCRRPKSAKWPFSGSPWKHGILTQEIRNFEMIVFFISIFQQMRDKNFCSRNPIGIPVSWLGSVGIVISRLAFINAARSMRFRMTAPAHATGNRLVLPLIIIGSIRVVCVFQFPLFRN